MSSPQQQQSSTNDRQSINPRWKYFTFRDTAHLFPDADHPPPESFKRRDGVFASYDRYRGDAQRPIVIDNGSYTCKVGWGGDTDPTLIFAPLVGKQRGGVGARQCVVGNDLQPSDFSRLNVRSAFDGEVVNNVELQERVLDYIFSNMRIDTDRVNHPVLMTECVSNPSECRSAVTELLFECYRVPSICYGIDAMFSYHHYRNSASGVSGQVLDNGLVVRSGFHATHVLPVVNGRFDPEQAIRLSIGGFETTDFTMRTMQLKYPQHTKHITLEKAEEFKEEHTYVAESFCEELNHLATDREYFDSQTHVARLPFETSIVRVPEKTEEQLAQEAERRKAFGDRMRLLAEKRKVEQKIEQEQQLQDLIELKELRTSNPALFDQYRKEYGYESSEEIDETIKYLQRKLKDAAMREKKKAENAVKETDDNDNESPQAVVAEADDSAPPISENQSPVVSATTPADDENTSAMTPTATEDLPRQQKQKQQSERTKKTKTGKKRKKESQKDAADSLFDEKLKEQRPEKYLKRLRNERVNLIRRVSMVKQMRAKAEESSSRSRRRTGASNKRLKAMAQALDDENDDTFGMEDEDWDLYSSINEAGIQAQMDLESMKKTEGQDEKLLRRIDEEIISMEQKLYGTTSLVPHQTEPTHFIDQYKYSLTKSPTIGTFKNEQEESEYHQMRYTVERIRVPEIMFQPSIVGIETAGLAELIDIVLRRYSHNRSLQDALARNVYICGGNTMFPKMSDRILREIRMLRPAGSEINVAYQRDPLDAWRGASAFAMDQSLFHSASITRQLYEEAGAGYLMEHGYSNRSILDIPK